jgi:hypothetical protein
MKQYMLSSGIQADVVDTIMLSIVMMVNCGEEEGLCGLYYASSSQHSMLARCEPGDIISLVTPRIWG